MRSIAEGRPDKLQGVKKVLFETGSLLWLVLGFSTFCLGCETYSKIRMVSQRSAWVLCSTPSSSSLIHTNDAGGSWSVKLLSKHGIFDFEVWNESVIWAVGTGGTVLRSNDAGRTWVRSRTNDLETLYAISFVDLNHVYVSGSNGKVVATSDGGESWRQLAAPSSTTLLDIAMRDVQNGIAISQEQIFRTSDGGANWGLSKGPDWQDLVSVQLTPRSELVVGRFGLVTISKSGEALIGRPVPGQGAIVDTVFVDGKNGWMIRSRIANQIATGSNREFAMSEGSLLKTRDGGVHWDLVKTFVDSSGPKYNFSSLTAFGPSTVWLLSNGGYLLSTDDSGVTWTEMNISTR